MKNFQTIRAAFPLASLFGKDAGGCSISSENVSGNDLRELFPVGSADRLYPLKPKNPI